MSGPSSRTRIALKLLRENPRRSYASVAAEAGIKPATVSAAVKRHKAQMHLRCPVCDRLLPYLKQVIRV